MISFKDRFLLSLQSLIDNLFFIFVGNALAFTIRVVGGLHFRNLKETRRMFRELCKSGDPIMVCSNHLTFLDSALIHIALSSNWNYLLHFRRFSWNIPAVENISHSRIFWPIIYLAKCIPIDRSGSQEHIQRVLGKVRYLLSRGAVFTIFPEGTRSRTGRVDVENVTYGAGQILKDVPNCRVLCAYVRGDAQESYGVFPQKKDTITATFELIHPVTDKKGIRAAKELSETIIAKIQQMENDYFMKRQDGSKA